MSRGWESKSVESQMEDAAEKQRNRKIAPPDAGEVRKRAERASLELSRTRVLADLAAAAHPRRRQQLEAALRHLDEKLAGIGP